MSSRGADSTWSSRVASVATPVRRASTGSSGAWIRVNTTTSRKTTSKIRSAAGSPRATGMVARTIGTAPRRPAQDMNTC